MARRRRIMRAFKLNEISAVDRPAQAHARVLIMKRHHEGIEKMNGIVDDTPSADQRLLESVSSIIEDDELDTATRNIMLLDSVRQYVIYTGADTATARPGAPLGGLASPDITVIEIHKRAEQDRRPGETIAQARARLWQDALVKRAVAGETVEQYRNRLKQERAERDGPPAHSKAVQDLRKYASSRFPQLSVAQAVAKIANSRDPADQELWAAAKNAA